MLLVLVAATTSSNPARAADCPGGNLLAGLRPWGWQDIRGNLQAPTDGRVGPEGAQWDAPLATVLASAAAGLTWDLGRAVELRAVWVQADAQDAYGLWGSLDGQRFRPLARIEGVSGHGLRGRRVLLRGEPVRYLRFAEGVGDGLYSLSEIQAFCLPPARYPPPVEVVAAPAARGARSIYTYWNDQTSARWELVLAIVALAVLQWRRRQEQPPLARWLAPLGVIAALTFFNFGFFHFGNFIHTHEWTHYYLGSKYHAELAHDRLYDCLSLADVEHGLRRRVELRKVTNLRTNVLETGADTLANPRRCRERFTDARWAAFTRDVSFFRARMAPAYWDKIFVDHGYNATPVWTMTGAALSRLGAASNTQLYLLSLLDPLYLLGAFALVHWAFGWRVLAVALLVFATNFPSRFYWTGGSFLRWDWLFYLAAAIACLKRQRPALAGACLAYAALLRVFPVLLFAGPMLALAHQLWTRRRQGHPLAATWLRFFAGSAVATAVLVPASLAVTGGIEGHRAFVQNTAKHAGTPLVNHLGLRTLLSWRPGDVARHTVDDARVDPFAHWKQARLDGYRQLRWLHLALVLGYLALLARAVRQHPPWVAAALGVGLIVFTVELTSYYYMFVLALALLHAAHPEVGRWLLAMTAFTQVIAWAPLRGMATWSDEQHVAMSAGSVLACGAILWLLARPAPLFQPDATKS